MRVLVTGMGGELGTRVVNLFEGDPCLLEVSLYPGAVLLEIPPTFLQEEVLTYEVSAAPSGDAVFTLATIPHSASLGPSMPAI